VNPIWLVAVSVGLPSFAWMVVRLRESTVYHHISERALEDCPAQQRPRILRALAEIAGKLKSDRPAIRRRASADSSPRE